MGNLDDPASPPELIEETLELIFKLLGISVHQKSPENEFSQYLQEIGGLDLLDRHLESENQNIQEKARFIIDQYYGFESISD